MAKKKSRKRKLQAATPIEDVKTDGEQQLKREKSAREVKAMQYLEMFNEERELWKFNTYLQAYLIRNVFAPSIIDKKHFKLFMKYAKDMKGGAKDRLMTACTEKRDEIDEISEEEITRETRLIKKRALDMLSVLSE